MPPSLSFNGVFATPLALVSCFVQARLRGSQGTSALLWLTAGHCKRDNFLLESFNNIAEVGKTVEELRIIYLDNVMVGIFDCEGTYIRCPQKFQDEPHLWDREKFPHVSATSSPYLGQSCLEGERRRGEALVSLRWFLAMMMPLTEAGRRNKGKRTDSTWAQISTEQSKVYNLLNSSQIVWFYSSKIWV